MATCKEKFYSQFAIQLLSSIFQQLIKVGNAGCGGWQRRAKIMAKGFSILFLSVSLIRPNGLLSAKN
jgi:hypothetical protein